MRGSERRGLWRAFRECSWKKAARLTCANFSFAGVGLLSGVRFLTSVGLLSGVAFLSGVACSSAPQEFIRLPLVARGTSEAEFEVDEDLQLSLTRADVAFGPLYICAGAQAGDNCDTARFEWRESAVVDTLGEEPVEIGTMVGVTGSVRSFMFDYGISSLLTESEPQLQKAAQELDGASLVVEGTATIDGTEIPFMLEVAVQQTNNTERGVPVIRKSSSDVFEGEVTESTSTLEVAFQPADWLRTLRRADFEAAAEDCELGVSDSCDMVSFDAKSRVAGVVGQAMTSGVRPLFTLR